jgi:hypothetical protein
MATGAVRLSFRPADGANTLAFSPDGRLLASVNNRSPSQVSPDGRTPPAGVKEDGPARIRLWDVATGQEVGQFAGHRGAIASLAFSPDGRLLVSGGNDTTALLWDVAAAVKAEPAPAVRLSDKELEGLWDALAGADAARAYGAMNTLAGAPRQALALFKERLRPLAATDPGKTGRLIADLDNDEFEVREKAMKGLETLGDAAEPALRRALEENPGPDVRRRLEELLGKLDGNGRLRETRAVELLERMGTAEARALCARLAAGAAEARLTQEGKAALSRLAKRPAGTP